MLQNFISHLFGKIMKAWSWVLLIGIALLLKFASTQPVWVEENYSTNIFPVISVFQRAVFGWIPWSMGDLFYTFLFLLVCFKTGQFFKTLYKKEMNRWYLLTGLKQLIFFFLFIYVFFYGLWGLNYNRQGIATKLGLELKPVTTGEIDSLTALLQQRLNDNAARISQKERDSIKRKKILFDKASEAFLYAEHTYPFLSYEPQSVKPSLFSYLGNYLGFQGYYNPFSGEAQVNTTIPLILEPIVTTHEIAHQLGYAKENEANFVAFLACRAYPNNVFRYSMYFDMYHYASMELFRKDSVRARAYQQTLHPQVKEDLNVLKKFIQRYKNPVEPVIMWLYGNYLQANNQPEGKRTYNMVVAYLVAYKKKYGADAL